MKKILLLALVVMLINTQAFSQDLFQSKKKQLSSLSFSLSGFSESLSGLSKEDILSIVKNPEDRMNMQGFTKSSGFSTAMTGEQLNVKLGLAKRIKPNLLAEMQIGFSAQTFGELVLDYESFDDQENVTNGIGLCYMHNRAGLSFGYKLRGFTDRSSFSIGPSVTAAKTFNDLVIYIGGNTSTSESTVKAKSSTITNFHFEMDYGYRVIGNLAINVGARYGYTYFISPVNDNTLGNNYSFSLGLEYQFFRNKFN